MKEAHAAMTAEYHWGCAFASPQGVTDWFTAAERKKLSRLGFYVAEVLADVVFAETPTQVVFGCIRPLSEAERHHLKDFG